MFEFKTLRVQWPAGKTLALAIPFLLFLFFLLEGTLRVDFVHNRLATPTMSSPHYQLGEKLSLLESYIAARGSLECVALGSSVVDTGFDPVAFAKAFYRTTGEEYDCFNFGIDGLPAAGVGVLAEILVQDYQPDFIIYGTDPRDFAESRESELTTVVMDTPWVQYRRGRFNLEGWLLEHFYLKRYSVQIRQLLVFNYELALKKQRNDLTARGQTPLYDVADSVGFAPDPNDDTFMVKYLTELLAQPELKKENLEGLMQIVELNSPDLAVYVVMMPVADGYYYFFDKGREEYDELVDRVDQLVTDNGVTLIKASAAGIVPENGWRDYVHLNVNGAEAFSAWLGEQIMMSIADEKLKVR